ncbi:MAG: hypothetical protein GY750_17670 [Lentisphaerae bacterium]|nr:hypothetical protein [Lentisphaerota bacterium]MCP4103228.1 hypothetical protein [Lentisphaerota bacterium]
MSNEFCDSIDSDVLYIGKTMHPVFTRVIEIICELIPEISEKQKTSFITGYRKAKYDTIMLSWMQDKTSNSSNYFGPSSEKVDTELRTHKAGVITNVFPLAQALVDYGYIFIEDPTERDKDLTISNENTFVVEKPPHNFFIPELDISRPGSSSWTKLDLKHKLSSEL